MFLSLKNNSNGDRKLLSLILIIAIIFSAFLGMRNTAEADSLRFNISISDYVKYGGPGQHTNIFLMDSSGLPRRVYAFCVKPNASDPHSNTKPGTKTYDTKRNQSRDKFIISYAARYAGEATPETTKIIDAFDRYCREEGINRVVMMHLWAARMHGESWNAYMGSSLKAQAERVMNKMMANSDDIDYRKFELKHSMEMIQKHIIVVLECIM